MTDNSRLPARNQPEQYLSALRSQPLPDSDLHIWRAALSASADELAYHSALLSPDESARAARFHFDRDRQRYIIGRGILRALLGSYLGIEPSQISITYGSQGKPAVETRIRNRTLQFNLSHSNDRVVYIFGWDHPLGIDIEHIRPMPDADDFAAHFFSTRESRWVKSLSGKKKWQAFFKLWTCKEAFLKANGSGLTVPLNEVEITFRADDSAASIFMGGDSHQAAEWHLETFTPLAQYQSAFVSAGNNRQVIHHQLDDLTD